MATNIIFHNYFDKIISISQSKSLDAFFKIYEIDGVLRKKETYKNSRLSYVQFYKAQNEIEIDLINSILGEYPGLGFTIVETENLGNYRVENSRDYDSNGAFQNYSYTEMYNLEGKLIYYKEIDNFTGFNEIRIQKYLYNVVIDDYEPEDLTFYYDDETLGLEEMGGKNPPFVPENWHTIKVDEMEMFFPNLLQSNPYYLNGNMLPAP